MSKTVVLVGHCGPDSSYLRLAIRAADRTAEVVGADDEASLQKAIGAGAALVLLNRVLDGEFAESEGAALIGRLRREHPGLRMMLVSNYPEAQAAAIANGALPGFGKRDLGSPGVAEMLRTVLSAES